MLILILFLSLWVGVNGVVFRQNTLDICTQDNYQLEYLCWYVPEFSPLIRPFIVHAALGVNDKLLLLAYGGLFVYALAPLTITLISHVKMKLGGFLALLRTPSWRI